MRFAWAALLSGATIWMGVATASADERLTLSGFQLDGVTPSSRYQPGEFQLRATVDRLTGADTDRTRDAILQDEFDADMSRLEMPENASTSSSQCTPARKALLAMAGRSEGSALTGTPQRGIVLAGPASNLRQGVASRSPRAPDTIRVMSVSGDAEPSARQAPNVASRTQQASAAPVRTVRADTASRPPAPIRPIGVGRTASASSLRDSLTRVRSEASRAIEAIRNEAFGMRR